MREIRLKNEEFTAISRQIFEQNGFFSFRAHGSSMYPFIRDGDILTVKSTDTVHLRTGDVILCKPSDGGPVAHRIISKSSKNNMIVLKVRGDSIFGFDQTVSADRILGKIISVCRGKRIIRTGQGFQRIAVYLWVQSYPLGPLFLQSAIKFKRGVTCLLLRIQKLWFYRSLVQRAQRSSQKN